VSQSVRFYAELWGRQGEEDVAVSWFGGLTNVQSGLASPFVAFELDLAWFSRSSIQGPYVLRNAVIQDVDSWVVINTAAEIQLSTSPSIVEAIQTAPRAFRDEITERMRQGVRPAAFALNASSFQDAPATLVLLHGYCSPVNPWSASTSDFSNAQYFLNPSASLSHDAYAQKVLEWANSFGGFSAIGHSQGGNVITHLRNYYWSGFDLLSGNGRLMQSVATPYQGNTAAGTLANIGKVFGIGCGTNTDLTVVGSTLWLSGITEATKAQVYYYTATYKQSAFIDYCNLAANLIIATYNDGTAEYKYTPLAGAVALGNAEPWCHSDGMKYPAVFLDHTRNVVMNGQARRS